MRRIFLLAVLLTALAISCAQAQTTVRVAPSGGDYTNLQSAINYCALTNNDANGCIVSVEPNYTHASVIRLCLPKQTKARRWITIRSSRIAEMPANRRVTREDAPKMPKLTALSTDPVVRFEAGAAYYRLEGFELYVNNRTTQNIIEIGLNNFKASEQPSHIVLDRLYIHGPELTNTSLKDAVKADGSDIHILNCRIEQIQNANGQETKGISSTNGAGPLNVRNNYISALSINTLMGGYPPAVVGQVMTGSRWLGNHYTKDIRWKSLDLPFNPTGPCLSGEWRRNTAAVPNTMWNCRSGAWTYVGKTQVIAGAPVNPCVSGDHWKDSNTMSFWDCINGVWVKTENSHLWTLGSPYGGEQKNLWECKTCRIALVEGNLIENAWAPGGGSQWGNAFLFNNVDSFTGTTRWTKLQSVMIRNNYTRNHGVIAGFGYLGPDTNYDERTREIVLENNLFENAVGPLHFLSTPGATGNRWMILGTAKDQRFVHNTFIGRQTIANGSFAQGFTYELAGGGTGVTFRDNIMPSGEAGFRSGDDLGPSNGLWNKWRGGDWTRNLVVEDVAGVAVPGMFDGTHSWGRKPDSPKGPCCRDWKFATAEAGGWAAVGFVNFHNGETDPVRQLRAKKLCSGVRTPDDACTAASPYAAAATDGTAFGANIDVIEWATATAESGDDNPWFDFQIRKAHRSGIRYTAFSSAKCSVTVDDDVNQSSPLLRIEDAGGDRDRTVGADALASLPPGIFYARVTCDEGRFRQSSMRTF